MTTLAEDEIDTPALVVNMPIVEANIRKAQDYANEHNLRLRPHIKTHKIPRLAQLQLDVGAVGINSQKISEAEVMVDGLAHPEDIDLLITYNILGERKLKRVADLAKRVKHLSLVADDISTIQGYSHTAQRNGVILGVMIECDTGGLRCGVTEPSEALRLALAVQKLPGLEFVGIMTFPPQGVPEVMIQWLSSMRDLFDEKSIAIPVLSVGGTPDMWSRHKLAKLTETRPGTYIYMDRSQIRAGAATLEDCAQTILSTVVSRPTPTRAICDAGTKALTSDLLGFEDFGIIKEFPRARISRLSEEHGVIEADRPEDMPTIGDRIHIVVNHACPVTNLFDYAYFIDQSGLVEKVPIPARGCVV